MDNFNSRDNAHYRFSREMADDGYSLQHIRPEQSWLTIGTQAGIVAFAVLTLVVIAWNV